MNYRQNHVEFFFTFKHVGDFTTERRLEDYK